MTPGWLKRRLPARGDERGTSLVYALLFTTIIAVVIAAVIGLASANLRATRALREQAAEAAAADGAAKVAINTLRVGDYNGSGDCLGGALPLPGFYRGADGSTISTRVDCSLDTGASQRPGATGAGFALLTLPNAGEEGLSLNGIDPPNPSQTAGMKTYGDVGDTGLTHIKHGQLEVWGDFNSGSCLLDTNTAIGDDAHELPDGTVQKDNITAASPECADPTGEDPEYELPSGAVPSAAGSWTPNGNCNNKVRTYHPGVYSTSTQLSALNDKCGVSYFEPGVYWFAFNDSDENSNNRKNKWLTQNTVVAGTLTAPGLNPDVEALADSCSPFSANYANGSGVLFVFGGRAVWEIDREAKVAICGKPSTVADQPALVFHGLTSSVACSPASVCGPAGAVPAQTGCTLRASTDSGACPTVRTTNASDILVHFEGATYIPHGWVDLDMHSSSQYITGGLVVRQFSLFSPASDELPAPLSSGPLPGGPGGARTVVYLTVYVCPQAANCATGGTLRLKAKVAIFDPAGAPEPGGYRPISVLSWSVQR